MTLGDELFLGVDCGTQSLKVLAVDARGRIHGSARRPLTSSLISGATATQDPAEWWEALRDCCAEALREAGSKRAVRGIGVGGTCSTILGVSMDFEPVTRALLWCDARAEEQALRLTDELAERGVKALIRADEMLARLLWIFEMELKAPRWVECVSWLVARLCGELSVPTSIRTGRWGHILDAEVRRVVFATHPELRSLWASVECEERPMAAPAGLLNPQAATHLGLSHVRSPVVVAVGGNDGLLAAIGAGLLRGRARAVEVGGSSYVLLYRTTRASECRATAWERLAVSDVEGSLFVESFSRAGLVLEGAKQFLQLSDDDRGQSARNADLMEPAPKVLPLTSRDLSDVERTRRVLIAHQGSPLGTLSALLRTIATHAANTWRDVSFAPDEIVLTGGFARNDLFYDFRQSVSLVAVRRRVVETGCLGAAMCAACAAGYFTSLSRAAAVYNVV